MALDDVILRIMKYYSSGRGRAAGSAWGGVADFLF